MITERSSDDHRVIIARSLDDRRMPIGYTWNTHQMIKLSISDNVLIIECSSNVNDHALIIH